MNISELPLEHWELAENWRDGGSPISSKGISPKGSAGLGEGVREATVSLGLLRTCFSERYGSHIPRMIHDLLLDVGQAFAASGDEARAAALPDQEKEETPGRGGGSAMTTTSPVTFHVTEYDVIKGQYPRSWEDHAGYIIPGGVASAVGKEPWMTTLLNEVQGLRETGRPVLAICLGHQVLAQALGGLVQPRVGSDRHYALQESELLFSPAESSSSSSSSFSSSSSSSPLCVVRDSVATVQRKEAGGSGDNGGGDGDVEGEGSSPPPLRLLYHHNDEVVKLPPGATNIATSGRCRIHGMMMMSEAPILAPALAPSRPSAEAATAASAASASMISVTASSEKQELPALNVLTFQAHPELNYDYGRRVMNGMLDADVAHGRLTHEDASRLKEQVLAWDHEEFPVAIELMRRLFAPVVPRTHGGSSG